MNPPNQNDGFSSGFEVGDVVLASGLPRLSLEALKEDNPTQNITRILSSANVSLPYEVCDGHPKYRIIAFGDGFGGELLSKLSSTLEPSPSEFEFVKYRGQEFSINKEAFLLFRALKEDENLFQKCSEKMEPKKTLIITGHTRGGCVASLLCLWLLQNKESADPASLPICITFGSPLLGDGGFCKAIQMRSLWKSQFLHVASYADLMPRTFLSEKTYKPFGTYLLCSSTGCACVDNPDSVLQVLETTESGPSQIPTNLMGYWNLLEHLTHQMILSNSIGVSQVWALSDEDPIRAGLTLQLDAIGIRTNQPDTIITDMVRRERESYDDNVWRIKHSERRLNECKIDMAKLEWYKKTCSTKGLKMGYYDSFKNRGERGERMDTVAGHSKIRISKYWEEVVTRAVTIPPMRQLEASITHMRMVEPLDIAEHYKNGNTDYRNKGRPNHYKVLEEWQGNRRRVNLIANTLTEDSCFWADVEEAMILTNSVKANLEAGRNPGESDIVNLSEFEEKVMGLIDRLAVSPEIFLKECSFMKWWDTYETIPMRNGNSRLSKFMTEGRYDGKVFPMV